MDQYHTLILGGVSVYLAYVAHKTSQWDLLWALAVIWPLFALGYVYFGMKYRILWDDTSLVMRASGVGERRIRFDEIAEIRKETAQVSEFLSQASPFRRVVVCRRRHDPNATIDIPCAISGLKTSRSSWTLSVFTDRTWIFRRFLDDPNPALATRRIGPRVNACNSDLSTAIPLLGESACTQLSP